MTIHKNNFESFLHSGYCIASYIKEGVDLAIFTKDLLDIRWLLANCYENDSRVCLKLDELNYRYGRYMGSYMRTIYPWLTNLGRLEFYLQNLHRLDISKVTANRINNRLGEKLLFGYIK